MNTPLLTRALATLVLLIGFRCALADSVAGTWTSNLGPVVFTESGFEVSGDMTFINGGTAKISGVLVENQLHCSYVLSTGQFGTARLTLAADGNRLEGEYQQQNASRAEPWILVRTGSGPAPGTGGVNIAGRWTSPRGDSVFEHTGTTVTGRHTYPNGQTATVNGEMVGQTFTFSYRMSTGGTGTGQLTLSADSNTLAGNLRDNATGRSLPMTFTRAGGAVPGPGPGPEPGPGPGPFTSDITGDWSSNLGRTVFQQSGTRVQGTLTLSTGQTVSIDGQMVGRVMAFSFRGGAMSGGFGHLTLANDNQRLSGNYLELPSRRHAGWNLTRGDGSSPPPATEIDISGNWTSAQGQTVFTQTGTTVTAQHTYPNGQTATINGQLLDRNLEFTYQMSVGGTGTGRLALSADGNTLTGQLTDAASGRSVNMTLTRSS